MVVGEYKYTQLLPGPSEKPIKIRFWYCSSNRVVSCLLRGWFHILLRPPCIFRLIPLKRASLVYRILD
jgi:hypothetical protein